MYSPVLTIAMTSETFHLVKNRMNIGRYRLLLGLGVFLVPTLFANAIFASVFHLGMEELIIATLITGVLLFNLTLYLLNKAKKGNRTLIFGFNTLRVLDNNKEAQVIPFTELKITQLTHGMDEEKSLPAIRIKAESFGCMTIGSTQFSEKWQATEKQIDCTTYLIPSQTEWQRFLEIINQLN